MQTLPIGSQRGWDGWGGWGMVLSVHCRTLRGGEKTLFNQPLCILGIVRISDGSSKTQHRPQQRTELRQSGEKTKKKPPEEPHELAYRTTSSASATHLPNKQTKKFCPSPSLLRTTDRPHFAVFVFIYFSLNGKKRQPRSGEGSAPRDSRLVSRDGARG